MNEKHDDAKRNSAPDDEASKKTGRDKKSIDAIKKDASDDTRDDSNGSNQSSSGSGACF